MNALIRFTSERERENEHATNQRAVVTVANETPCPMRGEKQRQKQPCQSVRPSAQEPVPALAIHCIRQSNVQSAPQPFSRDYIPWKAAVHKLRCRRPTQQDWVRAQYKILSGASR